MIETGLVQIAILAVLGAKKLKTTRIWSLGVYTITGNKTNKRAGTSTFHLGHNPLYK